MQIGVAVTKTVSFRSFAQPFSNIYYYRLATAITSPAQAILDEVVAFEKSIHSGDVTFQRGQVWSAGGTRQENNMLLQQNLSGVGAGPVQSSLDRERAVLVRWPAGVDVKGRPVYLRKFFHICGAWPGQAQWTSSVLQNTATIDAAIRTAIESKCQEIQDTNDGANGWVLCAKSGRVRQGGPTAHRYLEHHQLGDQWR